MTKYVFSNDFIQYEDFISKYNTKQKFFKQNEMVSSQYETLNCGYYIKNGIMKLSIGSECGKEKVLALFGPGSIFPLGVNEHHYNLEYAITEKAFTDLDVMEFSFIELRKMFCDNNSLALSMMEHYCDFTSFLFYDISSLSSDSSFMKICNIVYELSISEIFQTDYIAVNQADIADIAGISKIQVARAYQILKDKGIIDTKRNGFMVIDKDALFGLCSINFIDSSTDFK